MGNRRASLALVPALIAIACGSSGSPAANDDGGTQGGDGGPPPGDGGLPPDDGGPTSDGGACGAAVCADHPEVCGAVIDACKNVVYCGVCKYDSELVASLSTRAPIRLAVGASTVVAYEHQLATRGAGSWTSAPFATGTSTLDALSVAVAADGTPWIAYGDTALNVAHLDAGAWATEPLSGYAQYASAAIAIAGDGTPWVAYPGVVTGGGYSIVLAHRTSGAWQTSTVTTTTAEVQNVALAVIGQDLQIVWHDTKQGVMFAHGDGSGAFTPEPVDPTATGSASDGTTIGYGKDQLGLAVTGAGELHVAYRAGSVMHAVRASGAWSHEKVPRLSFFSQFENGPVRIAASKTGAVAIGTLGETIAILGLAGGTWREQPIVPRCNGLDDRLDLAFDATGALALAHTCRGQISFLVQHGTYPADYEPACSQILDALCAQACTCPKDKTSKCCINQNGSICVDPAPNCQAELLADRPPCANATLDPSVVYGCRDALTQNAQPTCEPPDAGEPGMTLPAACAPLY